MSSPSPLVLCLLLLGLSYRARADSGESVGPASTATPADADSYAYAPTGLYPLWDITGGVLSSGRVYLGSSAVEAGIPGGLQLGLSPTNLVLRVPNLRMKVRLYRNEQLQLAAQVGIYAVLAGAHEAFFSSRYSSGSAAAGRAVIALPLSLGVRWEARRWLVLHGGATALTVTGKAPVKTEVAPGVFTSVEFALHARHGLFLHGGQVGAGRGHTQLFGASYRFHARVFEARIGYVYRHSQDGIQSQPLLSAGFQL